jgi:hypothetical protein
MTLCSICLHAVDPRYARCPFCGSELDAENLEEIPEGSEWSIVRTVNTEIEARLIAGRLRSEGIPAFVLSQVDSTRNLTVGALALAKVFVPEIALVRARALLETPAAFDEE